MTCRGQERLLSLHVEGDLPARDAAVLEAHLEECEPCRGFLGGLQSSQSTLKELAAEPLNDDALAALSARIRGATRDGVARHWTVPYWVLAASLVATICGLVWLGEGTSRPPRPPFAVAGPSPRSPAGSPEERARQPVGHTWRVEGPKASMVLPGTEQPKPAAALSAEEADQLARAVVAVSQIESVEEVAAPTPAPGGRPPLMRLATSDPDIVIYWQLESDGGK